LFCSHILLVFHFLIISRLEKMGGLVYNLLGCLELNREGEISLTSIPTPAEAYRIVEKYNKESFHLEHAKTVSGVMGFFAREYDPEHVAFWETAGMLHDIDFELYPQQHCKKAPEMLRENGITDEQLIHAVVSHGYGVVSDVKPELYMEKVLFAVDELTGLIGAVALMRPTGLEDLGTKSVMKKFKTKAFAAGCSRDIITQGAELLEMPLNELIDKTIAAMKTIGTDNVSV